MPRTLRTLFNNRRRLALTLVSIALVSYLAWPGQQLNWLLVSASATTSVRGNEASLSALASPGVISFSNSSYSVSESDGSVTIMMTRTGGTDNKLVAKVGLTDVTTSGADYRSPGSVDPIFNSAPGFTSATGTNNVVVATAVQSDGKILLGGNFTVCRGIARNRIARLNQDGTLDTTFDPGIGPDQGGVSEIAVQADGKILISGFFFHYSGTPQVAIARLNPNGTLDTTFTPSPLVNAPASIALQDDGKLVIGGTFTEAGVTRPRVLRLNTDGSLDTTFNLGDGANTSFLGVQALQPDGKIIATGEFTSYNGVARNHIVRLNSDGSVDSAFNPATGLNDSLGATLQPDGKIIIAGNYTDVSGMHGLIRRLNSDGSPDPSFNSGTGPNLAIYSTALQPDGKIIIAGNFNTYNGTSRLRLARLNADGSLDPAFNPGFGANNPILSLNVQPDGRIIIAGEFTDYNGGYRNHIARVEGDFFVTWAAGDASDKSILLPIIDDPTPEANEMLTLSLIPLTADVTTGTNPTATLTIFDKDTSLTTVSGVGVYAGKATVTATLTAYNANPSGRKISFSFFGIAVGNATTDANGVATLTNVSLSGFNAGTYPNFVEAKFAGDADYSSSSVGTLTVAKATPTLSWNNPSNIISGTALNGSELNATANVPGTFQYNPPAGTQLGVGTHQLSVTFTPANQGNYTTTTASVQLMVDVATTPAVSFSSATSNVGEGDGNIAIIVNRTDTSTAASVNYTTSDTAGLTPCSTVNAIASSRCDYATSVGTLRFAAGESTRTIYIPIIDDNIADGNETFTLTLRNSSGASLGPITSATITITDNANGTGNPVDQTAFFVRQHYIDFLGREPDPTGYAGWQAIVNGCPPSGKDANGNYCDHVEVSSAFFRSEEFQTRAYPLYRFYSAVGKIPLYENFMPDFAKVSGFLSAQELEANKVAFINEFMTRADYQNLYGSITGNDAYMTALLNTLGLPNHPNKQAWVNALNSGTSRAVVFRAVTEDGQVYQKYYNEAFVIMQYFGYLRRSADISYLNWIQLMNTNGGDYRQMINGFLNSAEYRNRFGQ